MQLVSEFLGNLEFARHYYYAIRVSVKAFLAFFTNVSESNLL